MTKVITIKELSEYCLISSSDEEALRIRVGASLDDNIIQAMADNLVRLGRFKIV